MSEWNGTTAECRRCEGTGKYLPDLENPHPTLEPRDCYDCDGTGEVEKAAPPTAEERAVARKGELAALCEPRAVPVVEPELPRETAEEFRAKSAAWWARDRAARIRAGACGECGERGCPRVGGKDAACVVVAPGETP